MHGDSLSGRHRYLEYSFVRREDDGWPVFTRRAQTQRPNAVVDVQVEDLCPGLNVEYGDLSIM